MSDCEYEMEWPSDEEGQGGDDGGSEGEVEISNNFYQAEVSYKTEPEEALENFETVIMLEENREEKNFTFSSTKFIILITSQLGQYEKMI